MVPEPLRTPTEPDNSERELWPDYIEAYEDAMERTSSKHAPWYVFPSNHKWFRNLAISEILADTLEDMGLKLPLAQVDIAVAVGLYRRNLAGVKRWLRRESSGEDAKTLDDSNDSAPNGSKAGGAKSNESKPSLDEIRTRAYEIFQARQGGPGSEIGDWQKAEASASGDALRADASKADAPKGAQTPVDSGTIQEALTKFKSSLEHGLTQEEAASRLKKDGPNAIEEKRISPLKRFLSFLWGPIPWMIEIAAILSAVVRHWEDFVIIFFMLALNAVVGFWEEFKADNEIEALKQNLALHARVLRDGKWSDVEAKTLVSGDIVMVKLGNVIPADLKLVDGDYLSIDQSALTGESLPVDKKKNDVAYSGSIVRMGQMNGLVVATGMNTLFGRTATTGRERSDRFPLSEGGSQDRQFPHSDHTRPGRIDPDGRAISRRPAGRNPAICTDSYSSCNPGRIARRPVRHDGRRCIRAR